MSRVNNAVSKKEMSGIYWTKKIIKKKYISVENSEPKENVKKRIWRKPWTTKRLQKRKYLENSKPKKKI